MNLRLGILTKIEKYGYPEDDMRFQILNTISSAITYAMMRMSVYLTSKDQIISPDIVRMLIGIQGGDLLKLLEDDVKFTRLGFLTIIQFQIENFLKVLLSNLEKNNPPTNYYDIVKRILDVLEINDQKIKLEELNVLAYMRNCLHSNGVHTNPAKTFEIDGHKFEFETGKICHNTSWSEIILGLDHSINIIYEILEHKQIINLKKPLNSCYIPK